MKGKKSSMKRPPLNVAIFIFDGVEELDFCGPFEVFCLASRLDETAPFKVFTVSKDSRAVETRSGLSVNPHYSLTHCPKPDILLVPGGRGTRRELKNRATMEWIRSTAARADIVASVCTGALLLGKAGLLDDMESTTHHTAFDELRQVAPKTTVLETKRFTDNGHVLTSAGIAAGIDMSLHIVAKVGSDELAWATARQMEYRWKPLEESRTRKSEIDGGGGRQETKT